MSRIAVSASNGENIEKFAPLVAGAVKFAAGALARGAASKTGKLALAGKLLGGGDDDKKPSAASQVAGAMQQQAEARKQRQQNQIQNNMQMADRAKNNAQISTGEPMDMSWRLLKDWNWNSELSPMVRRAIIQRARLARRKGKYSKVHSSPSKHHDRQFAERYHPHQKMPEDARGLEPHEIAAAMADLYLENHPELYQALHEELPQPADPNQTNTPGMVFHALNTDNPKISDNTSWDTYAPVIAKPSMFAKPMVHTAVNSPISSAGNRHTIRVSSIRDYSHTYGGHNDVLPSKFNLIDPLSEIKALRDMPTNLPLQMPMPTEEEEEEKPTEADTLRRDYRIRQRNAGEEKWRDKISTVEDEKQNKIEQDVISRLATEASNIQQRDAKRAKQFEAQQAREQHLAAREQDELSVTQNEFMPGFYNVTDPAYPLQGTMLVGPFDNDKGQGYNYYHNHYQNQQTVQTGEPMDLAWRMLKEEDSYDEKVKRILDRLANQGITPGKNLNPMELAPHEQLWNDEADKDLQGKTDELFDYAIAQGVDPGELLDAWHDRASMVEGLDYGEPGSELGFRAHAVDPSQWKKLASEPMGLAWRMLKQMSDEQMQEWAYENLRNQGIIIPDEREEEVVPKPKIPTLYY